MRKKGNVFIKKGGERNENLRSYLKKSLDSNNSFLQESVTS
jgi:hypothetical protein